ncbi:MAG: hypothetical protein ACRDQU_17530 [Pseudonocardiaceae bacterium]
MYLGIIPVGAKRHYLAQGSFWLFDEEQVQVEGVSAGLDIVQPREVAIHIKAFNLLQQSAVRGPAARDLIHNSISELQQDQQS